MEKHLFNRSIMFPFFAGVENCAYAFFQNGTSSIHELMFWKLSIIIITSLVTRY